MSGDNYGIQHSGVGDVTNTGIQALGPGASAWGAPASGDDARRSRERAASTGRHRLGRETADITDADAPTAFVSYSHDSTTHIAAVLGLAELLAANGIHVEIDQWAGVERRDWGSWSVGHIERADFVVIVASRDYHRVGDGLVTTTENRGAQSESAVIRDRLHSDRDTWVPKLLPVVLPGHDVSEIPIFLQPYSLDHYIVDDLTIDGIKELLRVLTGQPNRVRPVRGAPPTLPPEPPALPERPDDAMQ